VEENMSAEYKKCPHCAEEIPAEAEKCPRCFSLLGGPAPQPAVKPQATYQVNSEGGSGYGFAIASLACGVLGLICCCVGPLGSILAIVFGYIAKSQMKRSGDMDGSGMATGGIILGIIGIILGIIGTAIGLLFSLIGSRVPGFC
jgi:hypothetical protein